MLSVNREFKTARMWISSVDREKKMARKFPGLQYVYHIPDHKLVWLQQKDCMFVNIVNMLIWIETRDIL